MPETNEGDAELGAAQEEGEGSEQTSEDSDETKEDE